MIKPNTVLFASDDSPDAVNDAREYIKAQGFTKSDVKLVQRGDMTLVISIRSIWNE
jgi:hypothetical protein